VALCAALFQAEGRGMPVAGFTDYRCPTCPAVVGRLSGLGGPPLAITWHEWPILGASSRFSARVALAAGLQGKHGEMHAHLMRRRLRPSEAGVRSAASALDLDADRLLSDMDSDAVASRLAESARLARQFGFVGTPALVIGGTVLDGLPAVGLLRRLAQAGGGPCSA
jgi:protein-disulfide isomerase